MKKLVIIVGSMMMVGTALSMNDQADATDQMTSYQFFPLHVGQTGHVMNPLKEYKDQANLYELMVRIIKNGEEQIEILQKRKSTAGEDSTQKRMMGLRIKNFALATSLHELEDLKSLYSDGNKLLQKIKPIRS